MFGIYLDENSLDFTGSNVSSQFAIVSNSSLLTATESSCKKGHSNSNWNGLLTCTEFRLQLAAYPLLRLAL